MGFLGRKPPASQTGTPQPLHKGVHVDLRAALVASVPALTVWRAQQAAPGAPLYSGGILDAWPAWVVDVLQVAGPEMEAIKAWVAWDAAQKGGRDG